MSSNDCISASTAASLLGVTSQTVRNWIRAGKLEGWQGTNGRWSVKRGSLDLADLSTKMPASGADDLERRLSSLGQTVDALQNERAAVQQTLEAVERERDRHRADAAALRDAAIRMNLMSRDVATAVRQMLDVLEQQSELVSQLLAPSTVSELQ